MSVALYLFTNLYQCFVASTLCQSGERELVSYYGLNWHFEGCPAESVGGACDSGSQF